MLSKNAQVLAQQLFDTGAIKFGEFRLKLHEKNPDAPLSPIYLDLRLMRSFPAVMATAIDVYKELISDLTFDLLADCPTAATPAVAILSYLMKIPMISPRKDDKGRGSGNKIDGVFHSGQIALLIDDLITHAESKFEAIGTLNTQGLIVKDVVVLVDREQGGASQLKNEGYTLHNSFTITEILNYYMASGKITTQQYDDAVSYLSAYASL